jgi:hypothetical protein
MSQEKSVEQRLLCLEDAVADLQRRMAALSPGGNWLEQVAGSMKDVEGFEEMSRLGREWRESQRMPEDEEPPS